ncbi:sensor histidine kinase [Euzebyella marina]|uniref:histidine kinase n=1 Tax=Euzebyella marina TaxID=1761453 RepID=A0A3G2L8S3_9FLAO|nr:sensor histidine kinase [Euzebyella marina]
MVRRAKINLNRLGNKTDLLLKFNYASSILSFVLGVICTFFINVEGTIPFIFFWYTGLNLLNVLLFKYHRNLTVMAIFTSILSWVSTVVISLFSGGIESPFIFVLAIIVLAGYVSTRLFGKVYMYVILSSILIIFFLGHFYPEHFRTEIPIASKEIFSLISLLFAVYLLGYIFGKNLLETHRSLFLSKEEIEIKIKEKENLLSEVHHRVKNNLQTVSSLLNLQSRNTKNGKVKELTKSSQNRVLSMAIIHEMLYLKQNISKIDFRSYVQGLTDYLIKSANADKKNIEVQIDIPDIQLGIDTAIPLGLLINEAFTNSIKYAFNETNKGLVDIELKRTDNPEEYKLRISDNGTGFTKQVNIKKAKSLGLKLIHNLARQLHGSARRLNTGHGTGYEVIFKDVQKH